MPTNLCHLLFLDAVASQRAVYCNFKTLSLYLTSYRVHYSIRVGLDGNAGLSEVGAGGPSLPKNFGRPVNPI